jgi:uncharacterized repeat protein (TIGR01451 family)
LTSTLVTHALRAAVIAALLPLLLLFAGGTAGAACPGGPCPPDPGDNTAPTLTQLLASVSVQEGQPAVNGGTFEDVDGNSVTITASPIGSVTKTGVDSGDWTWAIGSTDGPVVGTVVTIAATDGLDSSIVTFPVTIASLPPYAQFNAPATTNLNQDFQISLVPAMDSSVPDFAAGFNYRFDCGDGAWTNWSSTASMTCSANEIETLNVRGEVRDKDLEVGQYGATVYVVAADLSVTLSPSTTTPGIGDEMTLLVTLANDGPNATLVSVLFTLPEGLGYVLSEASAGSFSAGTLWSGINVAADDSETLTVTVRVEGAGPYLTTAQVWISNLTDPDSEPANHYQPGEDDYAEVTLTPPWPVCDGLPATIVGTINADTTLAGTSGNDVVVLLDGADVFDGLGGNDVICGGLGADTIHGGDGADTILGQKGGDTLHGDGGSDELVGATGADVLDGGADNDVVVGGPGVDSVSGGDGHDDVAGNDQADQLWGGAGLDDLKGGKGIDALDGGDDADTCNGNTPDPVTNGDTDLNCETRLNVP